ncbi:MAG: DnaJ domain-containing protein [Bacteroidetes bacterium]|nr:DnaJ domain-containing protein [Bacteroidota bacterium]
MYYFELFELPISLQVNKAALLKKYYQLSKQYHPDNYSLQDRNAQENALQMSTHINKAKNILDDSYKRLAYILREKNIIEEEEKYPLSPEFLGEMMEINERLMELEFEEDAEAKRNIQVDIDAIVASLDQKVAPIYQVENLETEPVDYLLLKDYYYKLKYLNRILERLR